MKSKIKNLMLTLISILLFAACKKEKNQTEISSESVLTKAVTVENGYLKFRDQKAFDSIITVLLQKPGTGINYFHRQFNNFTSYKDAYTEIEKEYETVNSPETFINFKNKYTSLITVKADSSLTYKFGTPLSSIFTNANGEVKIGDVMTVYTKDQKMISYKGNKLNEQELASIKKTDTIKHIYVVDISKSNVAVEGYVNGATTTRVIKSELYYNRDHRRRLFVDLWLDYIPRTNSETRNPDIPLSRFYFTSRQELRRTFGGWRTNETDYYFHNLNYDYAAFRRFPELPIVHNYRLPYHTVQNAYGPIIIDLGFKEGAGDGIEGVGVFKSGGVPDPPSFFVNWGNRVNK